MQGGTSALPIATEHFQQKPKCRKDISAGARWMGWCLGLRGLGGLERIKTNDFPGNLEPK